MTIESPFLKASRMVAFDVDLKQRVEIALIIGGYQVADFVRVFSWLLAAPISTWAAIIDDGSVQAILADHPALTEPGASLVSLVDVRSEGPDLAPSWRIDSAAIPDELIVAGIESAWRQRDALGLPITRADEGVF